jgi:hypothetical protein
VGAGFRLRCILESPPDGGAGKTSPALRRSRPRHPLGGAILSRMQP